MSGMGTIANTAAIICGTFLGLFLRRGLPEKWRETIMHGVALCIVVIGLQMAFETKNIIICVVSLVIGSIAGEWVDIENHLQRFGNWAGQKINNGSNGTSKKIADAFIAASLIYCVGAMAVVGSLQDGLMGDPTILYAKATLDGIIAVILAANMGVGVALSALCVLAYQGTLTMLAGFLQPFMTDAVIAEVTACGGILIIAIGINMLKLLEIRLANQLPAVFIAGIVAYFVD